MKNEKKNTVKIWTHEECRTNVERLTKILETKGREEFENAIRERERELEKKQSEYFSWHGEYEDYSNEIFLIRNLKDSIFSKHIIELNKKFDINEAFVNMETQRKIFNTHGGKNIAETIKNIESYIWYLRDERSKHFEETKAYKFYHVHIENYDSCLDKIKEWSNK